MHTWKNYGDENYFEHGGCLVRADVDIKGRYEVFYLMTDIPDDLSDDGHKAAFLYTIDLDDIDMDKLMEVLRLCGYDESEEVIGKAREEIITALSPELLVKECVECGIGFFSQVAYRNDYPMDLLDGLIFENDLKDWLRALGAEEFIPL